MQKLILVCFGTRPEYIKLKSIIDNIPNIKTCFTGQHKDLLKNIKVDYELNIDDNISENRLNNIMANILKYSYIFNDIEYVLVQGDTTTACSVAISAFNHGKKVIHLESGLRTGDLNYPYPEEMNRQLISRIASIHLCPTEINKQNLEKENVNGKIYVVGNSGLDNINIDGCEYGNQVLITMHRRDNLEIMDEWFEEIEKLANKYSDIEFMIPLHPNPFIQKYKNIFNKVKVVEPIEHNDMIEYIKKCKFVISDSGGLQEECSYLNKKIIVCRKKTERPESIGIHSFICDEPTKLENLVNDIMINYEVNEECPYGNGKSWEKISVILKNNYWDIFYKFNSNFNYEPSTFFNFVHNYLNDYPEHKTIIDLGCGNGRDLINFKNKGLKCTGIDNSIETCKILKENHNDINVICDSFVNNDYKDYDVYYSRFTLHAIPYSEVLKFIDNISNQMNEKSILFIETRSIKGTEYESNDYYEANFKSGIGDYHNRTLFNKDYLIKLFNEKDIFVEYEEDNNGLSPYKGEDPYLIRLVLRKVNVEKYLDKIITDQLLAKQFELKEYFDEIKDILEENSINYVVFFGNLIGLLRHNNLFIPWDDDIDILIDNNDIKKVKDIFEKKNYNIIADNKEICKLEKNNLHIDLFYNHKINKLVNLENYYYINNYRVPTDFNEAFKNFYKNFSYDKIMEECVIYNHLYNDRWGKNMIKIKKSIVDVMEILNLLKIKKKNKIKKIINELDNCKFEDKIKDICIYINITNSNFYFEEFIKSMIEFNLFDTYIYISDGFIKMLLSYDENYVNILKEKNIFLITKKNSSNSLFDKKIFESYLELDNNNNKNYDKVIIYQDFPIFINKYNIKNIYSNNFFNIEFNDESWYKKEIIKDKKIYEIINLNKIYGTSSDGICIEYQYFKEIFTHLNYLSDIFKGSYPLLEVLLPTYLKNSNKYNFFNVNKTLWRCNDNIDYKYLSITKKYS